MNLREVKKEAHALPDVRKTTTDFHNNWVKPIRSNTNSHLPFLQNLDRESRQELNEKLVEIQQHLGSIKESHLINEKLKSYAAHLIELKLTTLRDDPAKSKYITNRLLNDDFLNMKQTIADVKVFEEKVKQLQMQYEEVNTLLQKKLSLEEALFFMELPHLKYLQNLLQTSQQQKKIVRNLGRNFVSLARKTRKP